MLTVLPEWLAAHQTTILALLSGSLLLAIASLIVTPLVIARLPIEYFAAPKRADHPLRRSRPTLYWGLRLVKNMAGYTLILAGFAMLLLPGQGVLTILMGLVLADFPGKFRLERLLAARPGVLGTLNWIRRRLGAEPLEPPRL